MTDQNEENECTRDGVRYVFEETGNTSCERCAGTSQIKCGLLPQCLGEFRADKRTGIWVAKEVPQ